VLASAALNALYKKVAGLKGFKSKTISGRRV